MSSGISHHGEVYTFTPGNELAIIHNMTSGNPVDLCGRVNALIDRFFGGNRTAAARAWNVAQPTVQRLAVGSTATAKATTLASIAAHHDTTVDWLLNGRGPDPLAADRVPFVEHRDFRQLVDSLGLSPETRRAVLDLPRTTFAAYMILCQWGANPQYGHPPQPRRVTLTAIDANFKAASLQFTSWGHLIDGLIRAYGKDRVRDKLESEVRRIRLGFHPVPLELMWMPEAATVLDALEQRLENYGEQPVGLLMLDSPALPALDVIPPGHAKPKRGQRTTLGPADRFDDRE